MSFSNVKKLQRVELQRVFFKLNIYWNKNYSIRKSNTWEHVAEVKACNKTSSIKNQNYTSQRHNTNASHTHTHTKWYE